MTPFYKKSARWLYATIFLLVAAILFHHFVQARLAARGQELRRLAGAEGRLADLRKEVEAYEKSKMFLTAYTGGSAGGKPVLVNAAFPSSELYRLQKILASAHFDEGVMSVRRFSFAWDERDRSALQAGRPKVKVSLEAEKQFLINLNKSRP